MVLGPNGGFPIGRITQAIHPPQLWPFTSYSWLFLWDYTFYKWVFLVLITDSHGHNCRTVISASLSQITIQRGAVRGPELSWSNDRYPRQDRAPHGAKSDQRSRLTGMTVSRGAYTQIAKINQSSERCEYLPRSTHQL